MNGLAEGCISNKYDSFFGGTARIKSNICHVCSCCFKANDNNLFYTAKINETTETFKTIPVSIKIDCISKYPHTIKLTGIGTITKKVCGQEAITDTGCFELTICTRFWSQNFRVVIKADTNQDLDHDSGEVIIKDMDLFIGN